ncbi:MAG TPA: hypothetical protein IAB18_02965 [Candidatus Avisuccinivibrio pullicola]|nr:hypothetical protein [Candidatus Avisuccinivibrio pullicola]
MTDNLGSLSLRALGNENFSGVNLVTSQAEADALLGRPGRVSMDDNGKLVLVNPQEKPDNGLVRFFKGLRNPQYRAEQRALRRADVLAANESFNKTLTTQLIKYGKPELYGQPIAAKNEFSVKGLALLATSGRASAEVNLVDLKQMLSSTANRYTNVIAPAAKSCFVDNCVRADVSFKGKACTVYDFVSKLMPPENSSNNGKVPDAKTLGAAVVKHCAFHPETMDFLLPKKDGERLGVLLSELNVTGKGKDELRSLSKKAINSFIDKLNTMTQQALDRGCDPQQVSNLINDALWLTGRRDAGTLNKSIFDRDIQGSIAQKLAALPGGHPASPADTQTRAELDAVKAKLPGLDDAKAARVLSFCAAHSGMTLDRYADYVQTFAQAGREIINFGSGHTEYGIYHVAKEALDRAIGSYQAAHPGAHFAADDWMEVGGAVMFHAALTGSLSPFTPLFIKKGPEIYASQTEILTNPTRPESRQINDAERKSFAPLSQIMGGMLVMASESLEGTDGVFLGKPASMRKMTDLLLMDRVSSPQMQEHIRQSVADVEPQYRKGLASYLEGALRNITGEEHRAATAEEVTALKNRVVSDPKFMSLLNDAQVLTPEMEARYRNFLINDPGFSITSSLEQALHRPAGFDADGFHETFDKDVARHLFSEINGHAATNDVAEVRREFSELVPREFRPAMSALCMQGGLPACLSSIINFPEMAGDNERYNQLELASAYQPAMHLDHDTQLRREGDVLYVSLQTEQNYSNVDEAEPYGRFRLSVEVAVNLKGGVDEHGMPNSVSIISIGKEPLRGR